MQTKSTFGSPIFLRISKMLSNKTITTSISKNSLSLMIAALVIAQTGCRKPVWLQGIPDTTSSIDSAFANSLESKIDNVELIQQRNNVSGMQPIENTDELANGDVEVQIPRITARPGDKINMEEVRNSERLLGSANIFSTGGQNGSAPRIVLTPAGDDSPSTENDPNGGGGSGSRGSGSRY